MIPDTRIHAQGRDLVQFRLYGFTVRHDVSCIIVPRCKRGGSRGGVPLLRDSCIKTQLLYTGVVSPLCV